MKKVIAFTKWLAGTTIITALFITWVIYFDQPGGDDPIIKSGSQIQIMDYDGCRWGFNFNGDNVTLENPSPQKQYT